MNPVTALLNLFTGGLLKKVFDLADRYMAGQVSKEQFKAEVDKAALEARAETEKSWLESGSKQFESFNTSLRSSDVLQRAFTFTLVSQVMVLVWYQFGAPAFLLLTGKPWPSPGTTVEWAYLLVGGMVGLGPMVFNKRTSF